MKRQGIIMLGATIATTLVVAGCASADAGGDGGGATEPTTDGGAAVTEDVTLRYWTLVNPDGDDARSRALREQIETFEGENPGVEIEVETVPWDQITQRLLQASQAGAAPCVARILDLNIAAHAAAGDLLPLDDLADDAFKEDWLLGWEANATNGVTYSIPLEYRSPVLFYRSDYTNGAEAPDDWAEMVSMAQEFQSEDRPGVMAAFSPASLGVGLTNPLPSFIWDAGVEVFNEDGTIGFNNEAGHQVFENLAALVTEGVAPSSIATTQYEDAFQSLQAGTSIFTILDSHRAAVARGGADLDRETLQVGPLPSMTKAGESAPAHVNGWRLVVSSECEHPEEAWAFVSHMTSAETQLERVQLTGELPTRQSPYDDPWFATDDAAEYAGWAEWFAETGRTLNYGENWAQFGSIAADALGSMILQGVSAKDAVQSIADQYDPLVG